MRNPLPHLYSFRLHSSTPPLKPPCPLYFTWLYLFLYLSTTIHGSHCLLDIDKNNFQQTCRCSCRQFLYGRPCPFSSICEIHRNLDNEARKVNPIPGDPTSIRKWFGRQRFRCSTLFPLHLSKHLSVIKLGKAGR